MKIDSTCGVFGSLVKRVYSGTLLHVIIDYFENILLELAFLFQFNQSRYTHPNFIWIIIIFSFFLFRWRWRLLLLLLFHLRFSFFLLRLWFLSDSLLHHLPHILLLLGFFDLNLLTEILYLSSPLLRLLSSLKTSHNKYTIFSSSKYCLSLYD